MMGDKSLSAFWKITSCCRILVLVLWGSGIVLFPSLFLVSILCTILGSQYALYVVISLVSLVMLVPLDMPLTGRMKSFVVDSIGMIDEYLSPTVVFEDKDALNTDKPHVFGFEPHSILAHDMVFLSSLAGYLPSALNRINILVSSAIFWCPIIRNLFWWVGLRPIEKQVMRRLLAQGISTVLCPGGLQECLYMQRGCENIYLRKRMGFVRLAIEAGAPLVPVFAFGQTDIFYYWRPFLDWPQTSLVSFSMWQSMCRKVFHCVPLIVWPFPRHVRQYIVVGRPISVPKIEAPDDEVVTEYLNYFIAEMERLFYNHRDAAGYGDTNLVIH
jgi:diacylglycerol O-acyltransferase 2, plant